jgi:hypothetical protein
LLLLNVQKQQQLFLVSTQWFAFQGAWIAIVSSCPFPLIFLLFCVMAYLGQCVVLIQSLTMWSRNVACTHPSS